MQFIIILCICALILLLGIIGYDSNRFHVVHYELKSSKIKEEFHFVFLSDLHDKQYGKENEKLLKAIDVCSPDAILIGGDILTSKPGRDVTRASGFVGRLVSGYPVYYANGNHEQRLMLYPETYGSMGPDYEKQLRDMGISRLINQSTVNETYGIEIVGCEIHRDFYRRFRKTEMPGEYLQEILPEKREDCYSILLAHNPCYFENYAHWGADLTLSGHVHGGVARLPFIGGVIGTDFRLFPRYDGGLFKKNNHTMIVSRGLGAHTIPFRLFNPAELVDVVIRPE